MPGRQLKSTIRRKLLLRLGLACAVISIVLASAAYIRERDRVSGVVIERARQAVKRFNIQIQPQLDEAGTGQLNGEELARKLELFGRGSIEQSEGEYVLISIFDASGREVMRQVDPGYEHPRPLNDYMNRAGHELEEGDKAWFRIARIDGSPFIHVAEPLVDSGGRVVAHIEGIFKVSDQEIAAIDRRIWRTALTGVGIVLITTILIYPIITTLLGRLAGLTSRLLDSNMETLQVLGSAIAKRDSDTDAHNFRVTVYSVRIAERLGVDAERIRTLIKGAFLHDVGKIGIRDNVLLKPGPLTDDEYEVMKEHVNHGVDIVERSEWLLDATSVVGSHHEKYDGTGYHQGLKGEQIPVDARIFAVADVFDALTSRRPYKEPYTFEDTMDILEAGRGTHFDPVVLDAFSKIAPELYEQFADADLDGPRAELDNIVTRYFHMEIGELI
ncbi:MAG: HD domain-containing phosphohydrolase [Candidatus Latescibacterota bacterium]|jgi:putative nucleotidyltransferase with HDIG domain